MLPLWSYFGAVPDCARLSVFNLRRFDTTICRVQCLKNATFDMCAKMCTCMLSQFPFVYRTWHIICPCKFVVSCIFLLAYAKVWPEFPLWTFTFSLHFGIKRRLFGIKYDICPRWRRRFIRIVRHIQIGMHLAVGLWMWGGQRISRLQIMKGSADAHCTTP